MIEKFSRQDTLKLAGITSSHLSYPDRIGLIVPEKIGNGKKHYCFYTAEQIALIQQVDRLSQYFNVPTVRKFLANEEPYKAAMIEFSTGQTTPIARGL